MPRRWVVDAVFGLVQVLHSGLHCYQLDSVRSALSGSAVLEGTAWSSESLTWRSDAANEQTGTIACRAAEAPSTASEKFLGEVGEEQVEFVVEFGMSGEVGVVADDVEGDIAGQSDQFEVGA